MKVWLDDKNRYRDKYFLNKSEIGSREMFFGSEVAKGLEHKTIVIPDLIQYPTQEYKINTEINGVPFFAYIDQYDQSRFKFREIKTGKWKQYGLPRWTQRDVNEHFQLDIYSLLIQQKDGQVDDECHLDWIATRWKKKYIEFQGERLESESSELELTGELFSFPRVITQLERDRMRVLIESVANEISRDYESFLSQNPPTVIDE